MATKRDRMYERIECHGRNLLALFPRATLTDPVKLCKRLRRIEAQASQGAVDYCNGLMDCDGWERFTDTILDNLSEILQPEGVPIFVNGDPRGYALKIRDEWMREHRPALHTDWGGYGILAPDLTEDN